MVPRNLIHSMRSFLYSYTHNAVVNESVEVEVKMANWGKVPCFYIYTLHICNGSCRVVRPTVHVDRRTPFAYTADNNRLVYSLPERCAFICTIPHGFIIRRAYDRCGSCLIFRGLSGLFSSETAQQARANPGSASP